MQKLRFIAPIDIKERLLRLLRSEPVALSHPLLIRRQWNPINEPGAEYFGAGSSKCAYWICAHGHKIYRPICGIVRAYVNGSKFGGCGICSGYEPPEILSLKTAYPEIAAEWKTKENGTPVRYVSSRSRRLAQWECTNNAKHVFSTKVCKRADEKHRQGCPSCYTGPTVDLRDWPEAYKKYIRTKRNRGFKLRELPPGFSVFWRCELNPSHEWYESFNTLQERNFGCKKCHAANSATLAHFPELLAQIHPTKNGTIDAAKILHGSHKTMIWSCPQGPDHVWKAQVYNRTVNKAGCPCCANRQVSITNCLATVAPSVAKELHPSLNASYTPETIIASSNKLCWWRCQSCSNEWQTRVRDRTRSRGCCPNCKATPMDATVVSSVEQSDTAASKPEPSDADVIKNLEKFATQEVRGISTGDVLTSAQEQNKPALQASEPSKTPNLLALNTPHIVRLGAGSMPIRCKRMRLHTLARAP